jgi:hypothetical protein
MFIAIESPMWQIFMVLGFIVALVIAARIIGNKAKKKKNRR